MSDEYRVTVLIEKNGVSLPDFPLIRRLIFNESADTTIVASPDSNTTSYHEIAAATMPTLGLFFVAPDQAVNLKFNLNTPVSMDAQSIVLIMGCALAQGTPTQNIEYNNPSSSVSSNLQPLIIAGS